MLSIKLCFLLLIAGLSFINVVSCKPNRESSATDLAPFLNKKYVLETSDDKFNDIMEALGVGILDRNLALLAKPVMELTEHKGEYVLTSHSIFKNTATRFYIGQEFEDETPDGRKVKSLFIQDKNKLTQIQHGNKTTTIVREFFPELVKVTVQVDDIVSVRTYKVLDS
ncbi:regulation of retrograde trans-synaptic signaling by endocanabinoid [Homalodisca vitripennis]|nr:regulation of retrograde trans-synaptic signaling by endocanabinoid [Homalodisca vitripennis]